jgi:type IV pilus assembly protein PilB
MFKEHDQTVLDILYQCGAVDLAALKPYLDERDLAETSVIDVVLQNNFLSRTDFFQYMANYLGYDYLGDMPEEIEQSVISMIEPEEARRLGVIPIEFDGQTLTIVPKDPFNFSIFDELHFQLDLHIEVKVTDPDIVDSVMDELYGEEESYDDFLANIDSDLLDGLDEGSGSADLASHANESAVVRFVNLVLAQAVRDKASDIHFEPFEDEFKIRYRIDGALYEMAPPPLTLAIPVISRIKVLSELNIAERRVPQDGRIKITIEGSPVDLRVSTLPTTFGESVVCRVLDQSAVNLDLEKLSMPANIIKGVREAVDRPNGIFIVTGPTGSGKTTTLYAALKEVNKIGTKILTAEDPVEYEIEGIVQVPVNHAVGMDFAKVLRAFLRQDPDKIMVGEIRDLETAQIAVQASLTGHVVLSTLHTNDAAGAVTRLIDMGLEPFLIAASLETVLAQRLVRRVCKNCKTAFTPDKDMLDLLQINPTDIAGKSFYYGKGCRECAKTGYKGRLGLYEMINVTDAIRLLITDRAPTMIIKNKAMEQGMRTIREDGLRAILNGDTTVEEVLKYT